MNNDKIEFIDPKCLKEHPFSISIYGRDNQGDITGSIKEHGILVPLVIHGNDVISGHRRLRAALDIGLESVPCIHQQYASLTQEQEAILEYNRYRQKTVLQIYREGMALEKIERLKARQRQVRGGKHKVLQYLAQPSEKRKTRYLIAKAIGLGSGEQWRRLTFIARNNPQLMEQIGSSGLTINKAYEITKKNEIANNLPRTITVEREKGSAIMRFGSFEKLSCEIPDNSIEIILTNPAFKVSCIDRWKRLSSIGSRVLVDGGILITYVSKFFIVDAISALIQDLDYFWMIAFTLPSARRKIEEPQNVFTYWMPILIFTKGEPKTAALGDWKDLLLDKSKGKFNRLSCLPSARYLMRIFSSPNATVLDPFAHTGEFLIAATREGCHALGYEENADHYNIAVQRLFQEGNTLKLRCPRHNCHGSLFKEGDEVYCIQCGFRTSLTSFHLGDFAGTRGVPDH